MRRWLMLALGTAAQTAACAFVYGVPYLAPELREAEHLSLAQVGLLVACPTIGLVLALVAWGAAADRYGERVVISLGLGLSALALAAGLPSHGPVALGVSFTAAGAASASVSAASGRLVLGWFAAHERGLAMGLRQTSTPLGMGLAALALPPLAERGGVRAAVLFTAVLCAVIAVLAAALVVDPARPPAGGGEGGPGRAASPYRQPALWRIHGASALLVVPQFTVGAFALVFLVDVRHWHPVRAGQLLALAQVLGALSRIAAGRWSDRIEGRLAPPGGQPAGGESSGGESSGGARRLSRLLPMRRLAVVIAAVVALAATGAAWPSWASDVTLVVACGITASTNGLAFTATAELAGPAWAGRALGVQNTGQNLTASAAPPLVGALISAAGYPWAFGLAALFAAAAAFTVPVPVPASPANRRVGA